MRALIVACFALLIAIPCFAQPSVTVEPSQGPPAAEIKIEGKGFKPGEEVNIVINLGEGEKVALGTVKEDVVKANKKGEFSVVSGIPFNAKPGVYKINVTGNKGSSTEVKIEVTPKEKK